MASRHFARLAAVWAGSALWLLGAASGAQAHPLGNFSINHYTGFTVRTDRLDVLAVTDTAEIPTLQAAPKVDTDGDGTQSAAERAAWATARCAETAGRLTVAAPDKLTWTVASATFDYRPGQAGLRTSRLECRLHAPIDLARGPVRVTIATGADASRVGWNEITAKGAGTHLQHSTAPASSVTDELRDYPRDLLATPRGDTRARFTAVAGSGVSTVDGHGPSTALGGGLTGRVEALSQHLTSLSGARHLTVPVGLLAILLSVVLGAGHALLPGHGKTVMAAYLAGRRGSTRDAVTVGATVTITHTAGVLVIGVCLTTFSSLAGDTVLNWLGVVSGALVAVVGATLLTDAARRSRGARRLAAPEAVPAAVPQVALVGAPGSPEVDVARADPDAAGASAAAHGHEPGHSHAGGHAHEPGPVHEPGHAHELAQAHEPDHHHGPGHTHTHDHGHGDGHTHGHAHPHEKPHRHGLFGHHHGHGPAAAGAQPFTTRGLIGLGVAGGLVPSPSALVVLLGAIALGRTVFGATLVLAYGLGMAGTLTAVGLLLVRLGGRAGKLTDRPLFTRLRRITPYTALLTAALVLVVGLGLMARSLPTVL